MLEEINNFAGKQKHVLEHRCHTTLYRLTWSATQDIHNILNTCDVDVVDLTNVFHKLAQNSTSYFMVWYDNNEDDFSSGKSMAL